MTEEIRVPVDEVRRTVNGLEVAGTLPADQAGSALERLATSMTQLREVFVGPAPKYAPNRADRRAAARKRRRRG